MSVRFLCTSCNTSIKAKDEYSGKTVRCPHCREKTVVPNDDQPNDVLELGDDYGLAAMSVGEIEIDSPEMHIEKPRTRSAPAPLPDTLRVPFPEPLVESPAHNTSEPHGQYQLLLRASLGLRIVSGCAALVWLYILGGEFIEFMVGSKEAEPAGGAYLSPLLQLAVTFIVGASAVCLLAGASESLRALLDIRNSLARTGRR
ncbi:MAG: hypothetical protein SFV81_22480 [Pirellulaceae bacterium]|nr:hypothetical protein [Pirellulaceae bacterium]